MHISTIFQSNPMLLRVACCYGLFWCLVPFPIVPITTPNGRYFQQRRFPSHTRQPMSLYPQERQIYRDSMFCAVHDFKGKAQRAIGVKSFFFATQSNVLSLLHFVRSYKQSDTSPFEAALSPSTADLCSSGIRLISSASFLLYLHRNAWPTFS